MKHHSEAEIQAYIKKDVTTVLMPVKLFALISNRDAD